MRRAIVIATTLVLVGGFVAYLFRTSPNSSARPTITIAQVGDFFLYAPLYVAKDAGFFDQQGLDVKIISTGGDEKSWAAVFTGSAQFGVGDPTFVAISGERGQPGLVVASVVNGVPFWGITLRNDIPLITDPKQLAIYSVATFPAPSTAYTLQKEMFEKANLEPNIRQGGFGALIPMLLAKQADIALELEPNVSTAVTKQSARVIYSLSSYYPEFAITGLTTSPAFAKSDPKTVEAIVCALQKALDFIQRDEQDTLAILTKRFPEIEPSIALSALQRMKNQRIVPSNVTVSQLGWEKAIALRVQTGDLKTAKSMSSYVDNSFANLANANCRLGVKQ